MILNPNKKYARKSNVIYENGTPIIKLSQAFPDFDELNKTAINYMNDYFKTSPDLYEMIDRDDRPKIVKMFYDLETTGTDERKHGIHHISGLIEIDDQVVERFDFKVRPNPKAQIVPEALEVGGVTLEQIQAYPEMKVVYYEFRALLHKYVKQYDKKDKIWLVGYNNRCFDDPFLRAWFEQNGDQFFGALFWSDSLDALVFASEYLIKRRRSMENFKLVTVAKTIGIEVDEDKLHDAEYDIWLTREVYRIVTGLEIEL